MNGSGHSCMNEQGMLILYGSQESVYCAIVILVLNQKDIQFQFHPVDVFDKHGVPENHLARHPFGKIPVLQLGDFLLYETRAIIRYIDDSWPEPPLLPASALDRARVEQIMSVLDSYAYQTMVWDVYVQGSKEEGVDERRIANGLAQSEKCLQAIGRYQCSDSHLVGRSLSLADFYVYPMLKYFSQTKQGADLLTKFPRINLWLDSMSARFNFPPSTPPHKTP